MARAMNVTKRVDALNKIVKRTRSHAAKAEKICQELANSFKNDTTPKGKAAFRTAKSALRLSKNLAKATASVTIE